MNQKETEPNILYKYRDWSNEHHRRLLVARELYFASFKQFNDPWDGNIPFNYEPSQLTEENIYLKYREIINFEHPAMNPTQIDDRCYSFQRQGRWEDPKVIQNFIEDEKREIENYFGIVSLASDCSNFLMWSHYSKSHFGICVGFDRKLLLAQVQANFERVTYQNELPQLGLFDNPSISVNKLTCTKSKCWEYENEFRIVKHNFSRQNMILGPEIFKEIIFGCKMSYETKSKLIQEFSKIFPDVEIFEMQLSKDNFELIKFPLVSSKLAIS